MEIANFKMLDGMNNYPTLREMREGIVKILILTIEKRLLRKDKDELIIVGCREAKEKGNGLIEILYDIQNDTVDYYFVHKPFDELYLINERLVRIYTCFPKGFRSYRDTYKKQIENYYYKPLF